MEIIAPEDIRTEQMSFKDMIIRCQDRIHTVAAKMAEKNTRASISSYEEATAVLNCYLSPYYGKKFQKQVEYIQEKLLDERGSKDTERIALLRSWLALITENLGKVGILPPIDVVYDMATPAQLAREEEDEFLRVMRRLIKRDKKKWIMEMLRFNGRKPEKRLPPVEKPRIEDIIHPYYLGDEKK